MKHLILINLLALSLIHCDGGISSDLDLTGKSFILLNGQSLVSGNVNLCSSSSVSGGSSSSTSNDTWVYQSNYNQNSTQAGNSTSNSNWDSWNDNSAQGSYWNNNDNSGWGWGYNYHYNSQTGSYEYGYGYGYNYMRKMLSNDTEIEIYFKVQGQYEVTLNGESLGSGSWAYLGGNSIRISFGSFKIDIDVEVNGNEIEFLLNTADCSVGTSISASSPGTSSEAYYEGIQEPSQIPYALPSSSESLVQEDNQIVPIQIDKENL